MQSTLAVGWGVIATGALLSLWATAKTNKLLDAALDDWFHVRSEKDFSQAAPYALLTFFGFLFYPRIAWDVAVTLDFTHEQLVQVFAATAGFLGVQLLLLRPLLRKIMGKRH